MFEIVAAVHKALKIESTWAFVLLIALGTGAIGGFCAWIIDKGYKNSAEYRQSHQLATGIVPPTPHTTIPSDSSGTASATGPPLDKKKSSSKTSRRKNATQKDSKSELDCVGNVIDSRGTEVTIIERNGIQDNSGSPCSSVEVIDAKKLSIRDNTITKAPSNK